MKDYTDVWTQEDILKELKKEKSFIDEKGNPVESIKTDIKYGFLGLKTLKYRIIHDEDSARHFFISKEKRVSKNDAFIILSEIKIKGEKINKHLDCSYWIFSREIDFSEVQFIETVDFRQAQFNGFANFKDVQFITSVNLSKAIFNESTDFSKARFDGSVDFCKARFNGTVDFSEARVSGYSDFEKTHFVKCVDFRRARFSKVVDFTGVCFGDRFVLDEAWFDEGLKHNWKTSLE